jgi:salicylate synthetase
VGGRFHYRLRASFYGASAGEDAGYMAGWVQLCGPCAGNGLDAGEWPLLTLTAPREELIFEKGNVTVYADSADGCRRLCEWVKRSIRRHHAGQWLWIPPWTVKRIKQVARAVSAIRRGDYVKVIVSRAIPCQRGLICPLLLMDGRPTRPPVRLCFASKDAKRWVLVRNW